MTAPTTAAPAATTARLSAAELAAYLALVQAQAAARRQLTKAAVDAGIASLEVFTGWWGSAEITTLATQVLKQVQPAQTRAARLTDAYVARVVSKQRGRTVRPTGAIDVTKLRRKLAQEAIEKLARDEITVPVVELGDTFDGPGEDINRELEDLSDLVDVPPEWRDPADAYGRIADQYRWETISKGATHEEALEKVKVRAEQI